MVKLKLESTPPELAIAFPSSHPFGDFGQERSDDLTVGLLIVGPEASSSVALDPGRLQRSNVGWSIDPLVAIPKDLEGTPVVELAGGKIIGFLGIERGKPRVVVFGNPGK
jgi:hypothetical protein